LLKFARINSNREGGCHLAPPFSYAYGSAVGSEVAGDATDHQANILLRKINQIWENPIRFGQNLGKFV